jgi:hypothetical protein
VSLGDELVVRPVHPAAGRAQLVVDPGWQLRGRADPVVAVVHRERGGLGGLDAVGGVVGEPGLDFGASQDLGEVG